MLDVYDRGAPPTGTGGSGYVRADSPTLTGTVNLNGTPIGAPTSWMPSLTFGGNSSGMTYAIRTGVYTQVGNLVVASFEIQLNAKGTSTGVAAVGLPVSSSPIASSNGMCGFYTALGPAISGAITLSSKGAPIANLEYGGSAGSTITMDDTAFLSYPNGSRMQCSISYVSG